MTELAGSLAIVFRRAFERTVLPRLARSAPVGAVALALSVGACQGSSTVAGPTNSTVRFIATNALLAPVTIAIDDKPYVILTGGKSTGIAVSTASTWLTWTSAKPADSQGHLIPDDIGEERISVGAIGATLDISNVIDGQTYITARLFNNTNARVSIGVFDGSKVSCAAVLPAAASGGPPGFVQIGYYRLLPNTEMRAYHDGTGCTGPYLPWPSGAIRNYAAGSGLLSLYLDSAP